MTVRPSDPDATGRYQCRLLSGPDNIFTVEEDGCAVRAGRIQVLSLTQFYSVSFSQSRIVGKKSFFNKHTIKVCVSCC